MDVKEARAAAKKSGRYLSGSSAEKDAEMKVSRRSTGP